MKPLLKYKDSERSPGDRSGWTVTRWVDRGEPDQDNVDRDEIPAIGRGSAGEGGGLEVERLQASLAALQEENERWREASSRLYAMAVENVTL